MKTTTFVAGMRGVGKSTLLDTYKSKVIAIEAEAVQAKVVKLAKGEDYSSPYKWEVWDDEMQDNATQLLQTALQFQYPHLKSSDKPLLIVGALLIKDWFHESLLEALRPDFPIHVDNTKFYVVHLEPQIISNQIKTRGRPHESHYIGNLSLIEREQDGYVSQASHKWEKVTSHQALHAALSARF